MTRRFTSPTLFTLLAMLLPVAVAPALAAGQMPGTFLTGPADGAPEEIARDYLDEHLADLGLSRGDIGTIVAVNTAVGALLSPAAGAFADRLGGTLALVALFALGAVSFFIAGAAAGLTVLVIAGVVGGISQSLGNPAFQPPT